jgi:hypothetical protein
MHDPLDLAAIFFIHVAGDFKRSAGNPHSPPGQTALLH